MNQTETAQALEECLDFIEQMPHRGICRSFGEWACGQHGLLDKYRPAWRSDGPHPYIARIEPMTAWQRKASLVCVSALAFALILLIGAELVKAWTPACADVPIVKADPTPYKVRPPGWHMP